MRLYIPSIDNIAIRDKRKVANALAQDLDFYIYDMKTGPSLMNYRMSMIDVSPERQVAMRARIEHFVDTVNRLFSETDKHIEIEGNRFDIISRGERLPIEVLSSGEKQILLLLLRVFLLEDQESCILIDEPENSLDISWQYQLINMLVDLNPNAQFFVTTHSPSIFSDGWGDRIVYMEDIASER